MKTAIDIINSIYPNIYIIRKDRGNKGYYIMFGHREYDYISKKEIIYYLTRGRYYSDRKKKLITLKIMSE